MYGEIKRAITIITDKENGGKLTVYASYVMDLKDAAVECVKGLWQMISHPIQTAEGIGWLAKAIVPGTEENETMNLLFEHAVSSAINEFADGNANVRAKMMGRAVGEIVLAIVGTKGIDKAIKAIKIAAKSSKLANVLKTVLKGAKADGALVMLEELMVAIEKIEATLSKLKVSNIVEKTAEQLNEFWKLQGYTNPPYMIGTIVKKFTLSENTKFVRVYDKVSSFMRGGWVMKTEDVLGLTAEQIKDKYALKYLPKYICDVEMEAGAEMHCGIAGEIAEWGKGGGVQFDMNNKNIGKFFNEKLIQ